MMRDVLPGLLLATLVAGGTAAAATAAGAGTLASAAAADPVLGWAFDADHPLAERWARERAAALVTAVSDETRWAIRQTIARAFAEQIPPRDAARLIEPLIGLTDRDAAAVFALKRRLDAAKPGALVRAGNLKLRVPKAGLDADRAARFSSRYADQLLARRAMLIARTETIAAANEGQRQLWLQAVERGNLPSTARRTWIVTPDDRLCPICAGLDGESAGLNEAFSTGDYGPPAHPACRCAVGIEAASITSFLPALVPVALPATEPPAERSWSPGAVEFGGARTDTDAVFTDIQPEAFADGFLPALEGDHWTIDRFHVDPENSFASVSATSERGIEMKRSMWLDGAGNRHVNHNFLSVPSALQGQDIAKHLLDAQVEWYRSVGVVDVNVHANIDAGGYAWARYGFSPSSGSNAYSLAIRIKTRVAKLLDKGLISERTADFLDAAAERLGIADDATRGQALWYLADLRDPVTFAAPWTYDSELPALSGTMPLGRALLTGQDWIGRLSLSDDAALSRYRTYIAKKK